MKTELITFNDHELLTVEIDGHPHVAMRPICEALGVDWKSQFNRLKRDPVLSTCMVVTTMQIPGDDQRREVLFLDLDYLNGWLFGISALRVKPELRDRVIKYQRECYKALAGYFRERERKPALAAVKRQQRLETAYFARYPKDRKILALALQGNPFWFIAQRVPCHRHTVSTAVRRMIAWSLMDTHALEVAASGCAAIGLG